MRPVSQVISTKVADYVLRLAASVLVARYLGPADKGVLTFSALVNRQISAARCYEAILLSLWAMHETSD